MKPTRIEKEMRSFKIVQKCGYIGCTGEFEGVAIHTKNKKFIHECTKCNELILLEREYPFLEYEEVERIQVEEIKTEKEIENEVWDDDIPF